MSEGPKLWDQIYETVYGPIKRWPVRSLGFFALWLGVGFCFKHLQVFPEKPEVLSDALITLASIVPGVGIILCLHRLMVAREPVSRLKDVGVLENIKQSFVGRDDDAQNFITVILNSHQVWLNGDSGVGKSMLVQKAVLPELERRKIEAIYLNFWGGDWEEAPARAVLEKLGKRPDKHVFDALQKSFNSFRGVVILDQFDEFQIQHRDKFISSTGKLISQEDLESSNGFFRVLHAAILGRFVRCVFVTRLDVEWGKRPVLLQEAEEFFLSRLPRSVVEAEVARIISDEVVQQPENGWSELRTQLCEDLAEEGILPVQMRFAILGLEGIRESLNRRAYLRAGGLDGLVSGHLEREVSRVSGDRRLAQEILSVLDRLVTPDGKSTAPAAEAELLVTFDGERRGRVKRALEDLEKSDILRHVLSPDGAVLWRLDHDYLAAPVRRIVRRRLPEQWEMKEAYSRFVAAAWWDKPLRLASPIQLLRYIRARLFRGLRFGVATRWLLFSISAWFLMLALATYFGSNSIESAADEREGLRLFSAFSGMGFESDAEARALRELAKASFGARQTFLRAVLQSDSNSYRVEYLVHGMAIALSNVDTHNIGALSDNPIRHVLKQTQIDFGVTTVVVSLTADWGFDSSLTAPEIDTLAERVVDQVAGDKSPFGIMQIADLLAPPLGSSVSTNKADVFAGKLVSRMIEEKDPELQAGLATALGGLGSKVSADNANTLAGRLIDRMAREKNPKNLQGLAFALGGLGNRVSADNANTLAGKLVNRINEEDSLAGELGSGLHALTSRETPDQADALAGRLIDRMAREKNPKNLQGLAFALGGLGNRVSAARIDAAAGTLANEMMQEEDVKTLVELATGLGALGSKVSTTRIDTAARKLVEQATEDKSASALFGVTVVLNGLGSRVSADAADALAEKVWDTLAEEKDPLTRQMLLNGLINLGSKVSADKADELAEKLDEKMANSPFDCNSSAQSLGALANKVSAAKADELAEKLVDQQTKRSPESCPVWNVALRALASKVSAAKADQLAEKLVDSAAQGEYWKASDLAAGLSGFGSKVSAAEADQLAGKLVGQIAKENEPLRDLGTSLAALTATTLTSQQLEHISRVFEVANAPCTLVLRLHDTSMPSQLLRQLHNPDCAKSDWNQMALVLAHLTGQPIANGQLSEPFEIKVDFPKLCDYAASQLSWRDRWKLSWLQFVSILLLLGSVITLVIGLLKSPARAEIPS